jgi:hypothetical protein
MLVSILMPVYNAGKYLRQSSYGAINQTFIDFEGEKAGEIIPFNKGRSDTEKLYLAMKSYLTDREKLTKHSNLAKKAISKFEMNKYVDLYKEIICTQTQQKYSLL